jgi:hypothetical protein
MTNTTKTIRLYDSNTRTNVTAKELGLTRSEYDAACVTSMNSQAEGHIRVFGTKCGDKGRLVYAA